MIAIALAVIAIILAPRFPIELQRAVYTGSVTLIGAGIIGGFIKLIFDDVAAAGRVRADEATFLGNVLNDLKAVHDRVESARTLIQAHRPVPVYETEMRNMIAARIQLKNVIRALQKRPDLADDLASVRNNAETMERYLAPLTQEFEDKYESLADAQRRYEAQEAAFAKAVEGGDDRPLPDNEPWKKLESLECLKRFRRRDGYEEQFGAQLDNATERLRSEIANVLS